jgi:predicted outer membrane protein
MFWKHGLALVAAALVTLSAGAITAQERQPDDQDRTGAQQREGAAGQREGAAGQREGAQQFGQRQGAEGRQGRGQQVDQQVAYMLALGNQEEIQLSQFASEKAQNPQVKEFAQKMVQDHTQGLQKLQPFLAPGQWEEIQAWGSASGARPGQGRQGAQGAATRTDDQDPANQDRPGAARATDDQPDQPGAANQPGRQGREGRQPGAQAGQGQRGGVLAQIHKEAAQLCLQKTKEFLSEKQGQEFDHCYLAHQIVAHTGMTAKLEAAQNHVSPEFQQVIRESSQMAEQHLKEAQTIAQAIERGGQQGQPGRQPGRQPGATRTPGAQPGQAQQPGETDQP